MPRLPSPLVFAGLVPLFVAPGCLVTPEAFVEARARFQDADGDGISEYEGDCGPEDPATWPGAPELCDGKDNNCDGAVDNNPEGSLWFFDGDQDGHGDPNQPQAACDPPEGFVASSEDCDDADPAIHPDQPEACNDVDDDCDGSIDEDAPPSRSWFPDSDGDGHGNPATPLTICADPGGAYVLEGDDCDDDDASVHPGAPEACNGVDDDCDEQVDEAPTVDPHTWTWDADADGFGDDSTAVEQCLSPGEGFVRDGGDCNDADPTVYPGAPETCNRIDDDCDGTPDDPPTVGDGSWYVDLDLDGYGDDSSTETTCTPAEGMVDRGGDCDDTNDAVHPDATEICNDALDNDCDGSPAPCFWPTSLDMQDHTTIFGAVEPAGIGESGAMGDLDGDGADELYVSAYAGYDPTSGEQKGAILGWRTPIPTAPDALNPDIAIGGQYNGIGFSMDIGDLNGDGYDDLLSGNAVEFAVINGGGGAYVHLGPTSSTSLSSSNAWVLYGPNTAGYVGRSAHILDDLDGDGIRDYGISSEDEHAPYDGAGAVYIYTHIGTGTAWADEEADIAVFGERTSHKLGTDFDSLDVDGDGFSDLFVGELVGDSGAGGGRIFLGPVRGEAYASDADVHIIGEGGRTGISVDALGDVSGDGIDDFVLVGDQVSTGTGNGSAYIHWGSTTIGDVRVTDAEVKYRSDFTDQAFGFEVRNLGDLNQDGHTDMGVNSTMGFTSGTYLYFGPFSAPGTYSASTDADVSMAADGIHDTYLTALYSGDTNDDGVLDVMVGSSYGGTDDEGVLYIVDGVGY